MGRAAFRKQGGVATQEILRAVKTTWCPSPRASNLGVFSVAWSPPPQDVSTLTPGPPGTPSFGTYGQAAAGADGRRLGGRRAPDAARAPGGGGRPHARASGHGGRPRGRARSSSLGPGGSRRQRAAL